MNKHSLSRKRAAGLRPYARGFSLIEVVIAIAVVAVTFIGLIGLLGLGLVNDQNSSQQTLANNIAASILADLRSTPSYSTTGYSPRFGIALPTAFATSPPLTTADIAKLYYLYFDNSPNATPNAPPYVPYMAAQTSSVVPGAAYVANVYIAKIASVGPTLTGSLPQTMYMVRVVVSWPALTTTTPAGSVDVISQFLIH